jgi:hypothetical protein
MRKKKQQPTLVLPDCITGCFRSRAVTIDELTPGDRFYIVWAYGRSSVIRPLVFQGLRSIEFVTDSGMHKLVIKLQATDTFGADMFIGLEDVNLTGNSADRFTNHQCFKSLDDADYYRQLCIDFNIQPEFFRF